MSAKGVSHGQLRRRLARLEARPCSPAALVAEAHRLDAILQAGGELPKSPGRLTRIALRLVAASRALPTLMPGGGAYEEEEARLAELARQRVDATGQHSAGDDPDEPESDPRGVP